MKQQKPRQLKRERVRQDKIAQAKTLQLEDLTKNLKRGTKQRQPARVTKATRRLKAALSDSEVC
jgi:hypothetical protein